MDGNRRLGVSLIFQLGMDLNHLISDVTHVYATSNLARKVGFEPTYHRVTTDFIANYDTCEWNLMVADEGVEPSTFPV